MSKANPERERAVPRLPVFEYRGQLVTNSRDVAEEIGRPHWQILRTINTFCKHLGDNKIVVSDYFIPAEYISEQGKKMPCYYCTEMGCDMVANKQTGPRGTVFTARYVAAFHAMRAELAKRRELRAEGKRGHRELTDAVRDSGEVERMKGHAYTAYTNLAYRLATGQGAAQLRRQRGAREDAVAADLLTSEELAAYQRKEAAITILLDAGMVYEQIKAALGGQKGPLSRETGAERRAGSFRG